ncbi:MAG: type II secretion system F family protein [Thermoplasmata archaeon]
MIPAIADRTVEAAPAVAGTERPRLTAFERWAWRVFGRHAARVPPNEVLESTLLQAHIGRTSREYLAFVSAGTLVAAVASVALGGLLSGWLSVREPVSLAIGLGALVAVAGTALAYLALSFEPASRARQRGHAIDRQLSSAVNFVSAMSCADVRVDEIFRELAEQPLYGEAAEEATWIARDTDLLGIDILTALRSAARRSPSRRFQEFLQGVVATAESGGDLKPYFLNRSEQYEREGAISSRQGLERMGIFAEAFVTVAVAFPLFLIVILAVFSMVDGANPALILILWATVLGLIPATQLAFGVISHALSERL